MKSSLIWWDNKGSPIPKTVKEVSLHIVFYLINCESNLAHQGKFRAAHSAVNFAKPHKELKIEGV